MSTKTKKATKKARPARARTAKPSRNGTRRVRQPELPGMEQPRNEKIERLIDRWHAAKGEFKSAGTEFGASATLLGAAMQEEGVEVYVYDGKKVTYQPGKRKLTAKPIEEESVTGENGDAE